VEKSINKEIKVQVCDVCGEYRPLVKCDFCGKEVCGYCVADVHYTQLDTIRGHLLGFRYDRAMCQSHLPEVKDVCHS
jgi:hypothetical protein